MASENRVTMSTTLNLDSGPIEIIAIGDYLVIEGEGFSVSISDREMNHFVLAVRTVANAAGAEHLRLFYEKRQAEENGVRS